MGAFGAIGGRLAASALAGLLLLVGAGCGTAREWVDGSGGAGKTGASSAGGGGASTGTGGASTGSGGTTTTGTKLACASAADCAGGYCVDGVCCDVRCDDLCVACSEQLTGLPDGTCGPALVATDPHNDCSKDGALCGQTGFCDGNGACALQADPSVVCAGATCADGVRTDAKTCDGTGQCTVGGTTVCEEGCNAGGTGCSGDCTDESCPSNQHCDKVSGKCVDQTGQGEACSTAEQCATGFCVDGVCCDEACGDACYTCASGACAMAAAGSDLRGDCDAELASTCGTTGACNGAGSCERWGSGTECAAATCNGTTATLAKTCNGGGTCQSNGTQACPNGCSGAGCADGCTSGSCAPTEYCASGGACTAKKGNGANCGADNQCSSGFCVSGVCCNSACSAGCQECSSGTCTNVAGGQDPKSACIAEAASTCGTSGACDGAGACAKWGPDTVCAAATCDANKPVPERTCDGSGTCKSVSPGTACMLYLCVAGACTTSCVNNADCSASATCVAGKCKLGGACEPACGVGEHCCNDMPPYCQPMGMSCY